MATLTFMGAARTVTGSKHLLDVGGHRVLVDCGLFQGLKELRERNWQPLPIRATTSRPSCSRTRISITAGTCRAWWGRASAAASSARRRRPTSRASCSRTPRSCRKKTPSAPIASRYTKHQPALPLFTTDDANRAMTLLQPVGYDRPVPVAPGVEAEFINAGHLLGSAYARVRIAETSKTILFGGDLGRYGRPVLPDPTPIPRSRRPARRIHLRRSRARSGRRRASVGADCQRHGSPRRQGHHSGVRARPRRGTALLDQIARRAA